MTEDNDRQANSPNDPGQQPGASKIRHTPTGLGAGDSGVFRASVSGSPASSSLPAIDEDTDEAPLNPNAAVPVVDDDALANLRPKIVALGTDRKHEEEWRRTPNTTGQGAIHVRTFHTKLTDDALNYMDRTINEWLDAHPQYEVKFVNSTIGILTGKMKEPHLIVQVWV